MNSKSGSFHFFNLFVVQFFASNAFELVNKNIDGLLLDRTSDITNHSSWKLSPTNLRKWFEYYENTTQLTRNQPGTCSEIISSNFPNLDEVDGIWVACNDPTLPLDCEISPPCYPEINFSNGNNELRSVKFKIALLGFGTLRFHYRGLSCIDYSHRRDPMSSCQYVKISSTLKWVDIEISSSDFISLYGFTIQLFSRFKGDAVLIDRIEGFEKFICEDANGNHYLCLSTPSSVSTSTPTTIFPSSTSIDDRFLSILDIESDASTPADYKWHLPDKLTKWMEYYDNYQNFLDQRNNTLSCANLTSPEFINRNLPNVPGIWSSCRKYPTCHIDPTTCHPVINYKSPEGHYISSIKSKFHLQNTARIKLYVGDKCWHFMFENKTTSPCQFIRIPQLGDRWHDFYWAGQIFLPNRTATEFRLELIAQTNTDAVLLDRIDVQFKLCGNNGERLSEPTYSTELTTEAGTTSMDCGTTTEKPELTDGTAIMSETTDLLETTNIIETTTITDDSNGTICTTTRVPRTTTRRSGSCVSAYINKHVFILVFVMMIVQNLNNMV